jgi:hypothetical protein
MDIRDLVHSLMSNDPLTARQWVADATRAGMAWQEIGRPFGLDATELAVAAGVVELLASRMGQPAPAWTNQIPAAPATVFLVRSAQTMPQLRKLCEEHGPEPLRRRGILAPPDFLTAA